MKRFALALTTLALTAGAAAATTAHERPDPRTTPVVAEHKITVPASQVMSSTELARAGMNADDKVTVTAFPSSDVARLGNDNR